MEKARPHYDLVAMQQQIAHEGMVSFTFTAIQGGFALGLTQEQMLDVIASLSRRDFYKSMTSHRDHRVWQDVYHARCPNGKIAYIKLTHVVDRIVIQFKEK